MYPATQLDLTIRGWLPTRRVVVAVVVVLAAAVVVSAQASHVQLHSTGQQVRAS